MEWILATMAQCPLLLNGQSPPALLRCAMEWCTVGCQPHCMCCTFTTVLSQMQSIFVWLFVLAASQLTCASWWWCWCRCCFSHRGGRLALSSSNGMVCLWALWSVHLPWAPHWVPESGCHWFTTPFRRGGSCTGPMAVDKQLNKLAWYEIYHSFIVSSCINQKVWNKMNWRHWRSKWKE